MKVSIKGNDVTPEKIAAALAACEREHGLKIKGATIYVRFEDHLGRTVEPLQDGHEITREFTFQKRQPMKMPVVPEPQMPPEPVDPITAKEMMELCQKAARRSLSSPEMKKLIELERVIKVDRKRFKECLERTVLNTGSFNIHYLMKLIEHRCN